MVAVHARVTPARLWDHTPALSASAIERVRRGEAEVLGRLIRVGPDTDWHTDPVFGVTWPARFVDAMPYVQAGSDLVLLWHLNKTSFLVDGERRGNQIVGGPSISQA